MECAIGLIVGGALQMLLLLLLLETSIDLIRRYNNIYLRGGDRL